MKTTKIFYLAVTTVLLSVFATGCIPSGDPTPIDPPPPPQTDTSVVYHLSNQLVLNLTPTNNNNYQGDSVDLDSNSTKDIYFQAYNGNYGSAVTSTFSIGSTQLGIKSPSEHTFSLNNIINYTYFPYNHAVFGTHSGGTTTKFVGFRLQQTDGYHYGWMQLKMQAVFLGSAPFATATTIKTTLINYAYKKAPNTPIAAGAY